MSKRNCAALGHDLPAKERCAKRAGRGRHRSGPKCRLALRREVENDAGAIGNREPRQEPPGGQFLRGPFADARGNQIARATNGSRACPARCRAMAGAAARATVLSRRPGAPGSPPCVLLPRRQSPSALKEGIAKLPIPLTGVQPTAVEKAKGQPLGQPMDRPTKQSLDQPPAAALASTFAQVSRNPTVRLKTNRPGSESGSGQK
jgi:hypothetical protein